MTPLSDSIVIQAKVRTTMPVSIGVITAISTSAWPEPRRMRAIQWASGSSAPRVGVRPIAGRPNAEDPGGVEDEALVVARRQEGVGI